MDYINEGDISFGVQIAFLGSISLLTAGFVDGVKSFQGFFNPFFFFVFAGAVLLLTSSSYFILRLSKKRKGICLDICGWGIILGIISIFLGSIFLLLAFFKVGA